MKFLNKVVASLIIAIFLTTSTSAKAFDLASTSTSGTFTFLPKGSKAPFDGILFDPLAMGVIITDKEQSEEFFNLKLQYSLEKQKKELDLNIQNLNLSLQYEKKTSNDIILSKDKELKELRDIAINQNNYTWLYVGAGVLGGILLTVSVLYVAKKVDQL